MIEIALFIVGFAMGLWCGLKVQTEKAELCKLHEHRIRVLLLDIKHTLREIKGHDA